MFVLLHVQRHVNMYGYFSALVSISLVLYLLATQSVTKTIRMDRHASGNKFFSIILMHVTPYLSRLILGVTNDS